MSKKLRRPPKCWLSIGKSAALQNLNGGNGSSFHSGSVVLAHFILLWTLFKRLPHIFHNIEFRLNFLNVFSTSVFFFFHYSTEWNAKYCLYSPSGPNMKTANDGWACAFLILLLSLALNWASLTQAHSIHQIRNNAEVRLYYSLEGLTALFPAGLIAVWKLESGTGKTFVVPFLSAAKWELWY